MVEDRAHAGERGAEFEISVCICTFRREHVAKTIRSVLEQEGVEAGSFEIVVVDDDPERSAEAAVRSAAEGARVPVRYVPCGSRNIAIARNTCLDAARGAWIAFIDDDEIADPRWLSALRAVREETGAGVVKGYVRGVYPPGTPAWVLNGDPYTRDYGADGATPGTIATGNAFFDRLRVVTEGVRFNPAFGESGGEDSNFFRRVRAGGTKIVASRSAVVGEIVPEARVSARYLSAMHRRLGRTEGRNFHRGEAHFPLARALAIAARGMGTCWVYPLLRATGARSTYAVFRRFWYAVGLIEGLIGLAPRGFGNG